MQWTPYTKQNFPVVRCYQLQVAPVSEYTSPLMRDDVKYETNVYQTRPPSITRENNFQMDTLHKFESVDSNIPSLFMSRKLFEVCISI